MCHKNTILKLKERMRVYDRSQSFNATYGDIAMLIEDLIDILEEKDKIGFDNHTKQ